jgi:hypothetical protein
MRHPFDRVVIVGDNRPLGADTEVNTAARVRLGRAEGLLDDDCLHRRDQPATALAQSDRQDARLIRASPRTPAGSGLAVPGGLSPPRTRIRVPPSRRGPRTPGGRPSLGRPSRRAPARVLASRRSPPVWPGLAGVSCCDYRTYVRSWMPFRAGCNPARPAPGGILDGAGGAGWAAAAPVRRGRGKSGLHRAGCWPTASRGDPQDSATENRPPPCASRAVRVKRCGKSAPAAG